MTVDIRAGWQQVSGRIEPGELGWQAALREIREETGLAALAAPVRSLSG